MSEARLIVHEDGETKELQLAVGQSILDAALKQGVELDHACGGVCACSTCHVIISKKLFNRLEEPTEDEEDMLDQAFGLTTTSRLGCQVTIEREHDGTLLILPKATRNFYVDGHVPKPH